MKKLGLIPASIVVADPNDPALARRRRPRRGPRTAHLLDGPPHGLPRRADGLFQVSELDPIDTHIQKFAESTNLPWRDFGDAIDAVASASTSPRVPIPSAKPYDMFTITYRIGRTGSPPAPPTSLLGLLLTDLWQRARLRLPRHALFLQPRRAWLFDGYENQGALLQVGLHQASQYFNEAKFDVFLTDSPKNSANVWARLLLPLPSRRRRQRSTRRRDRDDFNLQPGKLRSADDSFHRRAGDGLLRPLLVYYAPGLPLHRRGPLARPRRSTPTGSAQEPYLQSFVTTPNVTGRILSSIPWAIATRYDETINQVPVWKLSCFGDPPSRWARPRPRPRSSSARGAQRTSRTPSPPR